MKKTILLILSVLLIVAITAGLLAHLVFFGTASSVQNKPIGANVSVTGSNVPAGIKAVTTSAQPPFTLAPLGPTVDISPSGKIQGGPITLRFKLSKRVSGQQVLLAVREAASSQWTLMKPSAVSADGWYVDVQTDHLSSWQMRLYDLDQTAKLFKSYFNGLSGDMFTQAEKPICANESLARQDGYSIDSSAKKTLYWCFGVEGKHRLLKVVNRTSYPLEVQHPGLTVEHQDFDLDFAQLARLGSGKTTILYPFEEIDFTLDDLPPGGKALLSTAYSGYAQSLYRLEVGVMSLISVVTRFGADNAGFSMLANKKGFQIVLKYMEALLKSKDCANAMFPVPNGGKVISGCFEPSEIIEALGWKGLLIAPFMAVGSLFEYFRSELESVIDLIGHNDKYMILVSRVAPGTVTTYEVPNGDVLRQITAGPDGNLWFTASRVTNSGRIGWIGRITPDGQVTAFPLPGSVASLDPGAITKGPDGNLWFVLSGDTSLFAPPGQGPVIPGQIGRITTGGVVKVFPAAAATSNPVFLATGPDGNVWFTDTDRSIGRITPDGQITEFPVSNALPYGGIAVGADGNMWFAAIGAIGRITLDGKVTLFPGTEDVCPEVSTCDLVAGPDGNLWFTDGGNGYIGRITLNGNITRFSTNSWPLEITVGPDSNLWFTNESGGSIGRITTGGSITFSAPNSQGLGITVGPDGNLWFTGGTPNHGIIMRMTL